MDARVAFTLVVAVCLSSLSAANGSTAEKATLNAQHFITCLLFTMLQTTSCVYMGECLLHFDRKMKLFPLGFIACAENTTRESGL